MNLNNKETDVIRTCLTTLQGLLGPKVATHLERETTHRRADFELTLRIQPPLHLTGECKGHIATRTQAHHAMLQARAFAPANEPVMVFAKWIPEVVAEEFRRNGVFFVDAAGNAYLHHAPQVVIDVRGHRPEAKPGPEPGRIVEAAGLKVCHALLTRPALLKRPLREIAEQAHVALGTAHIVVKELIAAGLLVPGKHNERRLADAKDVVDTFVRGYAFKLRPACLIGRFRHRKTPPAEILEAFRTRLAKTDGQWGLTGGMAARELTKHLEPNTIATFVDERAEEALKAELFPDRNGPITLLRLFAPTALAQKQPGQDPMTTPLLTYAELLNEAGPRELETAEMLLERFVLPGVAIDPRAA